MDVFDVGEFFHVGICSLKRAVDRVVGEEEKERFVVMTINEVDRFSSEGVGQVCRFFNRLPATDDRIVRVVIRLVTGPRVIKQPLLPDPVLLSLLTLNSARQGFAAQQGSHAIVGWRDKVVPLVSEAEKLVEAVAKRMILGGPTLMPFPDEAGGIATVVQRLGDRDFPWRQAKAGFLIKCSGGIEFVAKARRNSPGE